MGFCNEEVSEMAYMGDEGLLAEWHFDEYRISRSKT